MAEGGSQPPVINVQLPAITVNYQEGMRFAGDNVGQKTKIQAAEISQIVVPTEGNSQPASTQPNTLQDDSIPARVFKDSEEVKSSSSDRGSIVRTPTHPSPRDVIDNPGRSDVTGDLERMNLADHYWDLPQTLSIFL
ncbi:uncharacterized protein LOC144420934 [Styela clava]